MWDLRYHYNKIKEFSLCPQMQPLVSAFGPRFSSVSVFTWPLCSAWFQSAASVQSLTIRFSLVLIISPHAGSARFRLSAPVSCLVSLNPPSFTPRSTMAAVAYAPGFGLHPKWFSRVSAFGPWQQSGFGRQSPGLTWFQCSDSRFCLVWALEPRA